MANAFGAIVRMLELKVARVVLNIVGAPAWMATPVAEVPWSIDPTL